MVTATGSNTIPVFAERMRKVGGDKAADGFLAAMRTTKDALQHVGRGTHAPRRGDARLLDAADRQHAGPRDGDDAAHAV